MRSGFAAALATVAILVAGPVFAQKAGVEPPQVKVEPDQAELLQIGESLQSGDFETALTRIDRLVDRRDFKAYPIEFQRTMFNVRVGLALELNRFPQALGYARRATGVEGAGAEEWRLRFLAAFSAKDPDEAGEALIVLSGYGLEAFEGLDAEAVEQFAVTGVRDAQGGVALQSRLIDAMFKAGWRDTDGDWSDSVSRLWTLRAARAVEAGDLAYAMQLAAKVEAASSRAVIAVDRRFAPVREAMPSSVDVEGALDRELATARMAASSDPLDLGAAYALSFNLMGRGRLDEAYDVIDGALTRVAAAEGKPGVVGPDPDDLIWALDTRSRILVRLGRYDEAVRDLRRASRQPEGGRMNVSHAINLGDLYVSIDRPEAALETVADIGDGDASPYGMVQAYLVRACAFSALGRAAELKTTLSWIEAHADDAPGAVAEAAACTGQVDKAAADLIARLDDPERRSEALMSVQTYLKTPISTRSGEARSRFWAEVQARPDVAAAIERAGEVRNWPVLAILF